MQNFSFLSILKRINSHFCNFKDMAKTFLQLSFIDFGPTVNWMIENTLVSLKRLIYVCQFEKEELVFLDSTRNNDCRLYNDHFDDHSFLKGR